MLLLLCGEVRLFLWVFPASIRLNIRLDDLASFGDKASKTGIYPYSCPHRKLHLLLVANTLIVCRPFVGRTQVEDELMVGNYQVVFTSMSFFFRCSRFFALQHR